MAKIELVLFGGSSVPLFETIPHPSIRADQQQCAMLFGMRDLAEGPIGPREIYGGNMAVRTSVFDQGFRCNENIGPNGSDPGYPVGSETEFCLRVAGAGFLSWFAKE